MVVVDWKSCQRINAQDENEAIERIVHAHWEKKGRDLFSLEIGAYHGLSAALLAQYGIVFSIDLWGNLFDCEAHYDSIGQVNFTPFIQNILRLKLLGRVFPIVSSSVVLDSLPPMHFDIIYVDANHDYEPVKLDIRRATRHLRYDSLFIFHDYKREGDPPELGVNIAVDELLETGWFKIHETSKGLISLCRSSV